MQTGMMGALLSCRRNGVVVKIKCKSNLLELSTVGNDDVFSDLAIPSSIAFHSFHNIHALFHLARDHMLAIQPLCLGSADEKLGTINVGSSIAMDKIPGSLCFRIILSSSNFSLRWTWCQCHNGM